MVPKHVDKARRQSTSLMNLFKADPMSQSWQEGDDTDAKKLVRSQSAPPIRSDPIPEQGSSRQIKRVGSENPKALTRRRSSFRAGGSKYKKDPDSASATLQRRESKTIFADELGSALEEVRLPHNVIGA
jgi:hypothetical protein